MLGNHCNTTLIIILMSFYQIFSSVGFLSNLKFHLFNYNPSDGLIQETYNLGIKCKTQVKQGREIYDSDSQYEKQIKREEVYFQNLKLEDSVEAPLSKNVGVKQQQENEYEVQMNQKEIKREKKQSKNIEKVQNFENYEPEYSEEEEEEGSQNEDLSQEEDDFDSLQKQRQLKINPKKKQQNNLKQEVQVAQTNKKRKKKKKKRVVLSLILGAKEHIDSVDPFLKNTYNTVIEAKNFVSNIKRIAQRVQSGQDYYYDHQSNMEIRVTPTILDFIKFCQDSKRRGLFLVCDTVIDHFHLYFARNDMTIIGLIDENLRPFTEDKPVITNQKQFEDALYNSILFRQIVCLDENPCKPDDFAKNIRLDARNKIASLARLISRGYLTVKNQKLSSNTEDRKVKKQLSSPLAAHQPTFQLQDLLKVDNNIELKVESLFDQDYSHEKDERQLKSLMSNNQIRYRQQDGLYEESDGDNQFLF